MTVKCMFSSREALELEQSQYLLSTSYSELYQVSTKYFEDMLEEAFACQNT